MDVDEPTTSNVGGEQDPFEAQFNSDQNVRHQLIRLATALDIPESALQMASSVLNKEPTNTELFEALLRIIRRRYSPEAIAEATEYYKRLEETKKQPQFASLPGLGPRDSTLPLGFDTNDEKLNRAATILRLLYVADLRELQSSANVLTASLQSHTANPVTDASLGKVGK